MPSHKPDQSHRIWSGPGFSATRIENANNQGIGRISRVYKDSMVVIIRLRLGRTPCSAEVNHAWRCNTCLDVVGRRWCRTGVGDFPRMGDSHAGYGRTGTNREIPTVLPHHPHTTARIPVSPASTDTDSRPSVGRRPPPTPTVIQRQQTLLTTLTVTPASTNASTDTDSRLSVVGGLSRLIGRVSEMRKPRFHTESGFLWLRAGSADLAIFSRSLYQLSYRAMDG